MSDARFPSKPTDPATTSAGHDARAAAEPGSSPVISTDGENPTKRLGLAFGGGLPFGLVALGVRQAFEAHALPVTRMAGTSMGSIISAAWALGVSTDDCIQWFHQAFRRERMLAGLLRDLSFSPSGILKGREVLRMIEDLLGEKRRFEDLQIPLRIPACDVDTGEEVVFERGLLSPAIRASISLPGVFTPFRYQNRTLVDGALIRTIPVHLFHEDEVDLVLPIRAVRRRSAGLHDEIRKGRSRFGLKTVLSGPSENIFEIMWRSLSLISQDEFSELIFERYPLRIRPELDLELSRDTSRIDEIIEAGRQATESVLPDLRAALASAS